MTEPNEARLERLSEHFQPAALLDAFNRNGVNYVVVGGLAAVIHGAEVSTVDLDMVVDQSQENLDRVIDALFELDALRVTYTDSGTPVPESGYELTETVESFVTRQGHVDILREGRVIGGYDDIGPRAQAVVVRGQQVYVADLDTVIAEKEAASRPKDRDHLASLYDLRDTLRAAERGESVTEPPDQSRQSGADRLAEINARMLRYRVDLPGVEKAQQKQVADVAVVRLTHIGVPARTAFATRVDVRDTAIEDSSTSALVHCIEVSVTSWLAAPECGAVELPNRTRRGLTMFDRLLPGGTSGHRRIIRNRTAGIRHRDRRGATPEAEHGA